MAESEQKLRHLGIIVDGNRRWAREHNLPTIEGHRKGANQIESIIEKLQSTEVDFVSLYIFSTENWQRSPEEVRYLMRLITQSINHLAQKAKQNDLRIIILGRAEQVDPKLWQELMQIEDNTKNNTGLTACFCFNYGGLWEIVDAANQAIITGETRLAPETFRKYIYHPEVPDIDLIVRTSGEQRLSGFMLWRAAYAELLFLDKKFPDFEPNDCTEIIKQFHTRKRRFGK